MPLETMQGALCLVLCNLKAKKLGGFMSHGMVLVADASDKNMVDLIAPPEGSVLGDQVSFPGEDRNPP